MPGIETTNPNETIRPIESAETVRDEATPEQVSARLSSQADQMVSNSVAVADRLTKAVSKASGVSPDETLLTERERIENEMRHVRSSLDLRVRPADELVDVVLETGDEERTGEVKELQTRLQELEQLTNPKTPNWQIDWEAAAEYCDQETLDAYGKKAGSEKLFHFLYRMDSNFHPDPTSDWKAVLQSRFKKTEEEFFDAEFLTKLNARKNPQETKTQEGVDALFERMWFAENAMVANLSFVERKVGALVAFVSSPEEPTTDSSATGGRERSVQDWQQVRAILDAAKDDRLVRHRFLPTLQKIFSSEALLFPAGNKSAVSPVRKREAMSFFSEFAIDLAARDPALVSNVYDRFLTQAKDQFVLTADLARMVPTMLNVMDGKDRANAVRATVDVFAERSGSQLVDAAVLASGDKGLSTETYARLRQKGIDVNGDIVSTWKRCSPPTPEARLETIRKNLERMADLEKERPGCVRVLREEFGIENFARYPKELLVDQYDTKDDQSLPYGIVINPKADNNGAFAGKEDGGAIGTVWGTLQGKYRLRVFEAGSKFGIAKILLQTEQRYQKHGGEKISFALIGGHGEPDHIEFGGGMNEEILTATDLGGSAAARTKNRFFKENPTLVLSSCSTGKEGGIGQKLSEVLGARVIGPDVPTPLPSVSVSLDANGKPVFDATYYKAESMRYDSGRREVPIDA